VFQSITFIEDKFFLCVNNSDKIVVINKSDRKQVGTISIPQPRYVLSVSAEKAYVSTLFSNKVYIINPRNLQVLGSITMPYKNAEGMLLHNGKAYFSAWDTACNKIFRINTATDAVEQEITVGGYAPQEILADAKGRLWVLSGNVPKNKPAAFTCIDAATGNSIKSFVFPAKADPIRPVFNKAKDQLYFIEVNYNGGIEHNGIYKMSTEDNVLPAKPLIAAAQFQYFWALGYESSENKLYVGDPKGFVQKVQYIFMIPQASN
jgi:DNA-binding beta-propeller fold protein YncE